MKGLLASSSATLLESQEERAWQVTLFSLIIIAAGKSRAKMRSGSQGHSIRSVLSREDQPSALPGARGRAEPSAPPEAPDWRREAGLAGGPLQTSWELEERVAPSPGRGLFAPSSQGASPAGSSRVPHHGDSALQCGRGFETRVQEEVRGGPQLWNLF